MYMYVEIRYLCTSHYLGMCSTVDECNCIYRGRREGGEPRSDEPSTGEPAASSTTARVEPGDLETTPPESGVTAETTPRVPKLRSSGPRLRSRVPKHMRSILNEGIVIGYMMCIITCRVFNIVYCVMGYIMCIITCSVHYSVGRSKALPGGTCIVLARAVYIVQGENGHLN